MGRISEALQHGTPLTVTAEDLTARWDCGEPGENFRCTLCGYRFVLGDRFRLVFTNDTPGAGGNPKVCERCDGTREEIIAKMISMREEANNRMWWFCRRGK